MLQKKIFNLAERIFRHAEFLILQNVILLLQKQSFKSCRKEALILQKGMFNLAE